VPLIDRDEAIAKALELIDLDGIEAFSIRKLGGALGVNGASLYHHFKDKDEILHGVRLLILREARVFLPASKNATWQDYVAKSVTRYRAALLAHPNAAPLMTPGRMRPIGLAHRDHLVTKMLKDGVPPHYCYPIIDSVETLGFGSALFNPRQLPPGQRFAPLPLDELPGLDLAVRSAFRTADRLFRLELQALLEGWTALIDREGRCVLSSLACHAEAIRDPRRTSRPVPRPLVSIPEWSAFSACPGSLACLAGGAPAAGAGGGAVGGRRGRP
jgi:AcrR family transcriptional regulator